MEEETLIEVEFICPMCGKTHILKDISLDKYMAYINKEGLVQDIFPELKPVDREKLITGYCDECQSLLFHSEE